MRKGTKIHTRKEESHTNSRGVTSETVPLFIALVTITLIAVVLLNQASIGLVSRPSLQGSTPELNARPGAPIRTPMGIQFYTNLPGYDEPQTQQENDLAPTIPLLFVGATGLDASQSITNARVSIDGQLASNSITWDSTTRVATFPTVYAQDTALGEGAHSYDFDVQTSDGTHLQFTQHVTLDRTAPVMDTLTLSPDRRTLAFSLHDPRGQNGSTGSGLDNWNSLDALDSLNVALLHTTGTPFGTAPDESDRNPFTLETGLPNELECTQTTPNDTQGLNCHYTFDSALPADEMPVIFFSDDAGNRVIRPLIGNYEDLYAESVRAHQLENATLNLSASTALTNTAYFQGAGSTYTIDLYIVHAEPGSPDYDHAVAQLTFPDKVTNTRNAVEQAAQLWSNYIEQQYPGQAPTFTIGNVYGVVSESLVVQPGVQNQLSARLNIPASEYPVVFNQSCDFTAGGSARFTNECLERFNPCTFLGCTTPTTYWASSRLPRFDPDHVTFPKDPTHIPIVVVDYIGEPDVVGTAGWAELEHGVLYLSYDRFISPTTHHFQPNRYAQTMAHEMGHMLGLGHTDDSTNIMYGFSTMGTGANLSDIQAARIQAGLVRPEFKPPGLGIWYQSPPNNTPYFTDCGPVSGEPNAPGPRLLDQFVAKPEEAEAPYSGRVLNANQVLSKGLVQKYCPLVFDGMGNAIQPGPEAVDAGNVTQILSQYPNSVIKKAVKDSCICERDGSVPGNGIGTGTGPGGTGPGEVPTGGGGGAKVKTKTHKGGQTNCGLFIPTYTSNGSTGGGASTGTVSCSNEKCPDAIGAGGTAVAQSCQVAQGGSNCGNRATLVLNDTTYCCKCQPTNPPTQPIEEEITGDRFPQEP